MPYGFSVYDEFIAETAEPQVKVVFTTDSSVGRFKVLVLALDRVDDKGKVTFSTKDLYTLDALTPERPLVVRTTMCGAIPQYGISYIDGNGTTRYFAVEMSGKDGLSLLTEFRH